MMRFLIALLTVALPALPASAADDSSLRQGDSVVLGGKKLCVWVLDTLPVVENEISKAIVFDRYGDPVLEKLRRDCRLDDVVATGRNEFEKQRLLMDWACAQIEYGDPKELGNERNPLRLLEVSRKGRRLYCENFAALMISAFASMGYVARPVDIPTHSFTEIWSSQYRRWIMFDPTGRFYPVKDGLPANTWEMRMDGFENQGKNLSYFHGPRADPARGHALPPYHTLYYVFKREYLGEVPKGQEFIVRDKYSQGNGRTGPNLVKDPAVDPYYPINQASLTLSPQGDQLRVAIRTLTPNFKTFRVKVDDGPWADCGDTYLWTLKDGTNRLEAVSVNLFGVSGTVSKVELGVGPTSSRDIVLPACSFTAQGGGRVGIRPPEGNVDPASVQFWNTKGHWLEWAFDVPAAGTYNLSLTYATMFDAARQLTVNGKAVEGLETFALGPTFHWLDFSESLLPVRVPLAAGRNVVRMTALDDVNLGLSALRFSASDKKDILVDALGFTAEGGGHAQRHISPTRGYLRLWDDQGHWLEWTIDGASAGSYTLFVRYASMYPSPRQVLVSGQPVPGLEAFTLPPTAGWDRWMEEPAPAPVTLVAGKNVLRMINNVGKGLNLAGLRLVSGSKEILVDAPNFSGQGGGSVLVVARSRHDSFTGWDAKGHWLQWTVRGVEPGAYDLVLRYATKVSAKRELSLNGQPVAGLEAFSLPSTGSYQEWKEATLPVRLTLKQGDNLLRLTNLGGSMNLDEIRLTPAAK